jgi:DNA-binding MarR family transcriptional regulator
MAAGRRKIKPPETKVLKPACPRPDSEEQERWADWKRQRMVSMLLRMGVWLQRACDQRFSEFGMTAQDAALLLHCAEAGEITQGELADAVGRNKSKITRFADRLEPKGFLSRNMNTRDRRRSTIRVTKKGHRLAPLLKARFAEVRDELFRGILDMDIAQIEAAFAVLEANAQLLAAQVQPPANKLSHNASRTAATDT